MTPLEPLAPDEEERLAERARQGDALALAMLYRHLAPVLLGLLVRTLADRAEAEDVLHDTFLRLLDGRRRGDGPGHLRAWLFTVATRLAVDRLRRRKRRGEILAEAAAEIAPPALPDPEDRFLHDELLDRIEDSLSDLPATYAMAFHLRVRHRVPYREMAELLGDPEGTLRSRVHHALLRIRKSLVRVGYERPSRRAQEENTE